MYYSGNIPQSITDYSGNSASNFHGYSPVNTSTGAKSMNWLTGLLGGIGNFFSTLLTNKANKDINQSNLDYNTAMTQQQWERDDTAHQREVADLEAAGLSPLANTTGSQVTSALGAPNPIAMQAPQFDTNTLINSILESQKLGEDKRHNLEIEKQRDTELYLQGEQIQQKSRELDIQNKKVEADIKYQADLIQNEMNTLAEVKEHNNEEELLRRLEYESKMYFDEIKQQVPGNYRYDDIYDLDYYESRIKLWNLQFEHFMDEIGATQKASATSKSESTSNNFGVGANLPGTPVGGNLNAGGTISGSDSKYEMENLSERQKQLLIKFYNEHPKPVYHIQKWRLK